MPETHLFQHFFYIATPPLSTWSHAIFFPRAVFPLSVPKTKAIQGLAQVFGVCLTRKLSVQYLLGGIAMCCPSTSHFTV